MKPYVWDEKRIEVVENFITQEEADTLMRYCEDTLSLPEHEDSRERPRTMFTFASIEDEEVRDLMVDLEKRAYCYIVGEYFLKNNIRAINFNWKRDLEIVKWNSSGLQGHRDGHESVPTGFVNEYPVAISSLIYLTDDFNGGNLFFEDLDIKLKPKALSFVIFPSFLLHQVEEISKNENNVARYTIPFFYGFKADEFNAEYHQRKNAEEYEYGVKSLNKVYHAQLEH